MTCNGVEAKPIILNNVNNVNSVNFITVNKPKGGSIDKLISVFQPQTTTPISSPSPFRKSAVSSPPVTPSSIGETNQANSPQIQINNEILFSGSADKTIKFWNIQTGACIKTLIGILFTSLTRHIFIKFIK